MKNVVDILEDAVLDDDGDIRMAPEVECVEFLLRSVDPDPSERQGGLIERIADKVFD